MSVIVLLVAVAAAAAALWLGGPAMSRITEYYDRNRRWAFPASFLTFFVVVALLPIWLNEPQEELGVNVGVFALLSLGLNVVVGFAGLLDLGYVAFWALGAYTMAILGGSGPLQFAHLSMWQIMPIALVVTLVAGVLLGGPTLRLRGDYLAIVTLGFGEIIRILAENLEPITRGAKGITEIPSGELPHDTAFWRAVVDAGIHVENFWIRVFNFFAPGEDHALKPVSHARTIVFGSNPIPYYLLLIGVIMLMVLIIRRLNNSRVGRAWAAIREDEFAAESMGVPTLKYKLWAFAIGASTAGFSGVIYAARVRFVDPQSFVLIISITILAAVVLGGIGSIPGALVGGVVVTFIPEVLRSERLTNISSKFLDARYGIFGLTLILMMIFRPQGLVPSRRRAAELAGGADETKGPIGAGLPTGEHPGGPDVTP